MNSICPPLRVEAILLCLTIYLSTIGVFASQQSCLELGFSETLLCSGCNKMKEIINDEQLLAECHSCCEDDTEKPQKVEYTSASLEVCS